MLKISLLLSVLLLAGWTESLPHRTIDSLVDRSSYEGFKVFTLTLTPKQLDHLTKLKSLIPIDTWRDLRQVGPKNSKMAVLYTTDIMVDAQDVAFVTEYMKAHSIQHKTKIENVQSLTDKRIEASRKHQQLRAQRAGVNAIDWEDYYRSPAIYEWLDEVVAANSDIASISVAGKTTEGRDVKVVKISKAGSPANKKSVFIDGGFHAREWISPAISTWMINDLLTNRQSNQAVLDAYDFYIIPLVNVDGYEYSYTSRYWRKTRSDNDSPQGCLGVDPNRNSDFHFGGGGTSNDKCSDIYRGPSAFSEPEVGAVRDVINGNLGNWQAYFTIHSYGLMWLTPWSWTYDSPPDTVELVRFGEVGAEAINDVDGTRFDVGESSQVYGITAGSSDDWAHGVAGVKYSQTIEVDDGREGFETPAELIIPIATSTWEGIKASCLSVKDE